VQQGWLVAIAARVWGWGGGAQAQEPGEPAGEGMLQLGYRVELRTVGSGSLGGCTSSCSSSPGWWSGAVANLGWARLGYRSWRLLLMVLYEHVYVAVQYD
jgi:hypothetical protein